MKQLFNLLTLIAFSSTLVISTHAMQRRVITSHQPTGVTHTLDNPSHDPEAGPAHEIITDIQVTPYQRDALAEIVDIPRNVPILNHWLQLTEAQRMVLDQKMGIHSPQDLIAYAEKEYTSRRRQKCLSTCCWGTMLGLGAVVASGYADPALSYAGMSDGTSRNLRYGIMFKFGTQAAKKAYGYVAPGNTNHKKRD